jgi:hypothetical protein
MRILATTFALGSSASGQRFLLEHFFAEDGQWLVAFFDQSPDSEPFGALVVGQSVARR